MGLFDAFRRNSRAAGPAPAAAEDAARADALIREGHALEDAGDLAGALARYRAATLSSHASDFGEKSRSGR